MRKIISILEYIVCILIILDNNSAFAKIPSVGKYILPALIIFIVVLIILSIAFKMVDFKKMEKTILALCVFYLFFSIYLMYNVTDEKSYILRFMVCFIFLFVYYSTNKDGKVVKNVLVKYEKIILVISVVSFIFYILASTLKVIDNTGIIQTNWGNKKNIISYYNIYFETQVDYFNNIKITRNSGIFIESPMFAVNLVIALLVEIFVRENHKKYRTIILVITIITTTSLIGILSMLAILLIAFIKNKQVNSIGKFIKIVSFPIVGICVIVVALQLLQNKLDNNTTTGSYSLRMDDYKAQLRAWRDKPIFGNGYINDKAIEQYMNSNRFLSAGMTRTS